MTRVKISILISILSIFAVAIPKAIAAPFSQPSPLSEETSTLVAITQPATWETNATDLRGFLDQDFTFECSSRGRIGVVWGTTIYTDDSSICSAAVHAGLITARDGGVVTIRVRPGEDSYAGTNRNGVRNNDYGSWSVFSGNA